MLAIREISEWEYVTSQSVGLSGGAGMAVGGELGSSITLEHKDEGTHKFWYGSLGIGLGAGVKTSFNMPTVPSVALESFDSKGVLCILEAFKGKELKPSDITGFTLYLGVSAIIGPEGRSVTAMLLGIDGVKDLLKEAYSDVLQLGQTLGGGSQIILDLQDKVGIFQNTAKAVLFMGGTFAGLGAGVTALGSVGYVVQGTQDKIGEVILDLKSVEEIPVPVQITQKEKNTVISIPGDVLFDWDKAFIKPEGFSAIEQIMPQLQSDSTKSILIVGHTDNTEKTKGHNQILSEKRANSVYIYLTGRGIDASKMSKEGRAATEPRATNDTEDGRKKNRRVDFHLYQP